MMSNIIYSLLENYHRMRDGKLYVISIRNDMAAFPIFQTYSKKRAIARYNEYKKDFPHVEFDEI